MKFNKMEIGTEQYYRTITLQGFFNDNDREFLIEYFLREFKKAEKENYSANVFFTGCIKSLDEFKNINIVFHFASMTNAEKSFGKKKEMFSNNLNCLNTVIKFCENTGAKLVHLSSTSVYGKQASIVD